MWARIEAEMSLSRTIATGSLIARMLSVYSPKTSLLVKFPHLPIT